MPTSPAPCPLAERVRDELLARLDRHFARRDVRARLCNALDVAPGTLTGIVQTLAVRLFPEAFDIAAVGVVPVAGLPRIGRDALAAFAATP